MLYPMTTCSWMQKDLQFPLGRIKKQGVPDSANTKLHMPDSANTGLYMPDSANTELHMPDSANTRLHEMIKAKFTLSPFNMKFG